MEERSSPLHGSSPETAQQGRPSQWKALFPHPSPSRPPDSYQEPQLGVTLLSTVPGTKRRREWEKKALVRPFQIQASNLWELHSRDSIPLPTTPKFLVQKTTMQL